MKKLITICVLAALLSAAGTVQAEVFNVSSGESIQAAIDGATDNDTINVAAGAYYEILNVRVGVSINGAGQATYDGSGNYTGGTLITRDPSNGGEASTEMVNISGDSASMSNLTVDGAYGMDQNTGQTTNYGIFVGGQSATLSSVSVVNSTNHGIEFNNSNNSSLINVSVIRNQNAPAYYGAANSGIRLVDSEGITASGILIDNATRGVVAFQGVGSASVTDYTFNGNASATYGYQIDISDTPGWWNLDWGVYEGNQSITFGGTQNINDAQWGVYASDTGVNATQITFATSLANFSFVENEWAFVRANNADISGLANFLTASGTVYDHTDGGAMYYVVPEPATMSLLALGGLGVLARRRRRNA